VASNILREHGEKSEGHSEVEEHDNEKAALE
jgi:hypothetical protein